MRKKSSIFEHPAVEKHYERLQSFALPFMALFERDGLPARSTLSRFLAALTEEPVKALCTLFLNDLLAGPLTPDKQTGGLVDRVGNSWAVFDIDGTREVARQRALSQGNDLPPAFRRFDDVCTPGYTGRKRGQTLRTRTTISQAHSYHCLGSFGKRGNGQYQIELGQGLAAIMRYVTSYHLEPSRVLVRLHGQYGLGAEIADVASFAFVTRGKERVHRAGSLAGSSSSALASRSDATAPGINAGVILPALTTETSLWNHSVRMLANSAAAPIPHSSNHLYYRIPNARPLHRGQAALRAK